jgi:glycerol-3-phosphate dehydrogenase (NAD(P)+)
MIEKTSEHKSISVIGSGSWGTALALQLSEKNNPVKMWGRNPANIKNINSTRENKRYLPGITIPNNIHLSSDLEEATEGSEIVLLATPSNNFREILIELKNLKRKFNICWATKGFEVNTGLLPHNICEEIFGKKQNMAVISGPSFASEVARKKPTAVTIASNDLTFGQYIASSLSDINFRAYTTQDITGVEIGGAVKNILAIGAGISDGLNYGDNARIALINRGLVEMQRLGVSLGADKNTFLGLSGMGDLVLTCTSNLSRNRRFGLAIAKGQSISKAKNEINQVIEGIDATAAVSKLSDKMNIDMPICKTISRIIFNGLKPQVAVRELMSRDLQAE